MDSVSKHAPKRSKPAQSEGISKRSRKDIACANAIASLSEYIYDTDDSAESVSENIEQFIEITNALFYRFTEPWDLKWTSWKTDTGCVFEGLIKWPYIHIIPFDLMPKLMGVVYSVGKNSNIRKVIMTSDNATLNSGARIVQIYCTFTEDAFENGYYAKCENCGNCWDGQAQCMCNLDDLSQSLE
jgi:hypothetical protein